MTPPLAHAAGPGWAVLAPLGLATLASVSYALRVRTLAGLGRGPDRRRQIAFYAGVAVLLAALLSPLDGAAERLFWPHMAQHLLIADAAALLLLAGIDGAVLGPLLAWGQRLRPLAHPLVALPLWALAIYVWHLPVLYEAALGSEALHALEHLSFLAAGALMWAAVLEPLPGPVWFGAGAKAAYVLVVRGLGAILASALIWAGEPLYTAYAASERAAGVNPLTDQAIGGAIMFVEGAVVTLVAFAWLFLRWTREAELRQSLLEAGEGSRVASRAARYGRRDLPRHRSAPSPAIRDRSEA